MSGLSKALRLAVLVAAVGGCALGNSRQESTEGSRMADQDSTGLGGEASLGDIAANPFAEAFADTPLPEETPNEQDLALGEGAGPFNLRLLQQSRNTRFILGADDPEVKYVVKTQEGPPRVIVDILDKPTQLSRDIPLSSDSYVRSVRVGGHSDRTRFVFDLASEENASFKHQVEREGSSIIVSFYSDESLPSVVEASPSGADALGQLAANPSSDRISEPEEAIASESSLAIAEIDRSVAPESAEDQNQPEQNQPVGESESPIEEPAELSQPAAAPETQVALTEMRFVKTAESPNGEVTLVLTDQVPFYLRRTTSSEYALTLAGVRPEPKTLTPLISPASAKGIRSARVTTEGDVVIVRMFVDPGVDLTARPAGSNVLIAATSPSDARAQLQPPAAEAQKPPEQAQPAAPVGGSEISPVAGSSDDETARRNPTGIPSADGSKIYTGRLISLDLQETDIDNALRIIAEVSNLNIIASDDVTGKVTLRLIDVPWDQALDVILKTNGLDQVTEGNVIRIAPVDKLRQEREALREAKKAAENLEDLKVKYIRISYARATELKEQVEAVLSERGTVSVDERTNQLIVKDIAKGHEEVTQLIKRLDLRTPQVLLETQIVEATSNILRDLGFQWNFSYVQSPETGNATGLVFPNSVDLGGVFAAPAGSSNVISAVLDSADGSRALTARLSYLEQEGRARVISRPQVATVNNKLAEIRSVETLRVRLPDSGLSVATGQGATASGAGQSAFQTIDVGIELKVTPQASPDYYVLMDIDAKSSTLGSQVVDDIPSTIERQATSTILVKSGQTFALGGVYRILDSNTLDGVPFLKDVPVLGHFFRKSRVQNSDEELIFFITPHIVEGSFDPSLM